MVTERMHFALRNCDLRFEVFFLEKKLVTLCWLGMCKKMRWQMRRNKEIQDRQNSCRDRGREGRIERTVFRDSGKPIETHLRESRKLNNRRKEREN